MRVLVPIALLVLALSTLGATAIQLEGTVGTENLRFTLDSKILTISLLEKGNSSFVLRHLPLGGGFTLSRSRGTLGYHQRSLQTVIVDRLVIARSQGELLLFGQQNSIYGAIFSLGPLSIGLTQTDQAATPKLFHRWQDERSGLLYSGRWRLQKGAFKVDLEVAGSEGRPLRLIEELSYQAGPFFISRQIGPLAGQRSQKVLLSLASKTIQMRTLWSVELGPEALYSGLYQTMQRSLESTLSFQGSAWKVTLAQRVSLAFDKKGEARHSRHLEATLKIGELQIFLAWDDGKVRRRFEDSRLRISQEKDTFSASFGFAKDGWHFDLTFTDRAFVSVKWSYTFTIDRGNESLRPR